jgi:DNA-binding NarL/FixJ family response regulator
MPSSGNTLITIADRSLDVIANAKEALAPSQRPSVSEATSFDVVLRKLAITPSEILVFSLSLPGSRYFSGLAGVKAIRRQHPGLKMIAWVDGCSSSSISSAISIGVEGISFAASISTELKQAISRVKSGGKYMSPQLHSTQSRDVRAPILSPAEQEVMRLMHIGLNNWEIAQACGISASTVSKHRQSALLKLTLGNPSVWPPDKSNLTLTPEEDQVMRMISTGLTTTEITEICGRPTSVIAKQKKSALLKLTIDEAAIWQAGTNPLAQPSHAPPGECDSKVSNS